MGRCAGPGGSSGLLRAGASSPPAGPGLAVVPSLAHWHEGGKGHLPRDAEVPCSQPGTVGFSHSAGDVSGAGGTEAALAESHWLLKECASVFPSLEQAGTSSAHSTWLPGGCRGLCRGAVCCAGGTVEIQASGQGPGDAQRCVRALSTLLEGRQQPLEFAMQHLPCQRGLLCCGAWGISQGVVNARKPERQRWMDGLCPCPAAAAQGHECAPSPQPRCRSPSRPSAGPASLADRLHVGKG